MAWQTPKTNWAAGDGVANGDLNRIEENVRMLSQSAGAFGTFTGSANVYSVTASPPLTSLSEGACVAVKINVTNTAGSTINVNGLGAKAIKRGNGLDVAAGQLKAGSIYTLRYNGVNFTLQGEGGSGNATASDLLSGKTASVDAGDIVGTMPDRGAVNHSLPINGSYTIPAGYHNGIGKVTQSITTKGAQTYTPGTANQTIAAGQYLSGAQTISGSANLLAGNIKSGVNIFGVIGSLIEGYANFATGTMMSTSGGYQRITISGLGFKPTVVIAGVASGSSFFTSYAPGIAFATVNYFQDSSYTYTSTAANFTSSGISEMIVLESSGSSNVRWFAFA